MASSMTHIAIASEINKKLNRNRSKLLIGTIAPDISKLVNETKLYSHFLDSNNSDIPNLDRFLMKYKSKLNDAFVLGYYIHLYTDYLWFKYFLPEIYDSNKHFITKLDGTTVDCHGKMAYHYIYNDYTNLNIKIIDEYDLNLKIFYNEIPEFENIIEEIPMDKLNLIVNKAGEIIENSKIYKEFTFNMDNVNNFIRMSVDLITSNLEELGIY